MATSSPLQDRPSLHAVPSGFRRSFTAPPRSLSYHEKAGLDPSDSAADILYSHPSARIIKFSPPFSAVRSVSSPANSHDLDYPVDTIETLPWASTTETTVASGLLIIEKVRGSTTFLKSGAVTYAILRNSQCWCVDGESKFVLRTGKFQYYRIELPAASENDRAKVEELKVVLGKILRFERTPCPFKRGFHVDLAESDITPRRKGTWKRRQSLQVSTQVGASPSPRSRPWSSRTEARQAGLPFGEQGQEVESANGSEYDEDEGHSESDGHEERFSHSTGSLLESTADLPDEPKEDLDTNIKPGESEPPIDGVNDGQATTDPFVSVIEPPEVVMDDPPQTESVLSQEAIEPITESEYPESQPRKTETVLSQEATEPITEPEYPESLPHMTESTHSAAGIFIEPEEHEEAPQQPTLDLTEPTARDVANSEAIYEEPVLAETGHEEEQNPGLTETMADEADTPIEAQVDPRPLDTMSIASSSNSFHSLDAPGSPDSVASFSPRVSPPSPTPRAELFDPLAIHSSHAHKREISELTITPSSPCLDPISDIAITPSERLSTSTSDRPTTPPLTQSSASDGSWTEVETPSGPPKNQMRRRLKSRRSLSPLPPSPTLYTPSPPRDRSNHLTSAILQKACSLALGKPIEVVAMLIHILARIAGGATVNDLLSGDLFRKPGQGRENQPNRNFPDQIDSNEDDELDEDDFGVPLRGRGRSNDVVKADDDADSLLDLD